MFVKSILATLGLAALALAGSGAAKCSSDQKVVCKDNGNGGVLTLGNVLPGALGVDCSGGDVYCCDKGAVEDVSDNSFTAARTAVSSLAYIETNKTFQVGLVNLDVNAQCSLNHVL
jgi:hypothetical protein